MGYGKNSSYSGVWLLILLLTFGSMSSSADPTRPFFRSEKKVKTTKKPLELQAIFIQTSGASAVINDKVVREGDTIQGALIKKIMQGEVHFLRNKRIGVLKLNKRVVEKLKVGV